VRRLMAAYRDKSDLIAIGAYQRGSDPLTDAAIDARDPINGFLRQHVEERTSAVEADAALTQLALLSSVPDAAPVAAPPEPAPASSPGTPLHSAIPPLHLAA
jgi:flagellum-specific ATP synthase